MRAKACIEGDEGYPRRRNMASSRGIKSALS